MKRLEPREILKISAWVRDYYSSMSINLGITEDLLEPRLLDDEEMVLIAQYIDTVGKKLREWVDRLIAGEGKDFVAYGFYVGIRLTLLDGRTLHPLTPKECTVAMQSSFCFK